MDIRTTRAEIYELARLLRLFGDNEGARQVIIALTITEDAAALTAIRHLKQLQEPRQ